MPPKSPIIDISEDPGLNRIPIQLKMTKEFIIDTPKYQWIRQVPDPRDIPYQLNLSTPISSTVDLRPWCSPIDNQLALGSCTGNATAGAIEYIDNRFNNKKITVSRLFIYYYERLIEGTVNSDSGAMVRDAIKATYNYGAPLESLWPYNISQYKVRPSPAAIADGVKRKVSLYQSVADFNGCINALHSGYPVLIGFDVYSSFESATVAKTGIMPYPNTKTEKLLGGHCVLLVGYDMSTDQFIVRNSWGTGWGIAGYFMMPFKVIQDTSMSSDFWIIKSVTNS